MFVDPGVAGLVVAAALMLGAAMPLAWRRFVDRPLTPTGAFGSKAIRAALQMLVDAIPAMISCKDRNGRYVLMNAYQAGVYGTIPAAAVGRTSIDLLGSERGTLMLELDEQVVRTGQSIGPVEQRYADAEGTIRVWRTSKRPIMDSRGEVTHIATTAFDMTESKRIEGLLVEARNEAEAANRAKAAFLATMSHELRTPLNAIIGFSELISQAIYGPLGSPKYGEYARDVMDSGHFLLSIINDILDLSKVEAGQMILNPAALDVTEVLDRCRRLLAPRAHRDGVTLVTNVDKHVPRVYADSRLLMQIVTNLLSNAIKFSSAGGRVSLEATARDGWIELRIVDQGIGMSEDEIAIALRPFEQVDREHARKHEGTGLGLPIVKALVDLHGGRLAIESRPGVGTSVIVYMPSEHHGSSASAQVQASAASG